MEPEQIRQFVPKATRLSSRVAFGLALSELARPRAVLARFGAGSFDAPVPTAPSIGHREAGTDCLRDPAHPGAPASGERLNPPWPWMAQGLASPFRAARWVPRGDVDRNL
jgi:hypothetical protein